MKKQFQVYKAGFLGRKTKYGKPVETQDEAKKLFYEARSKGSKDVRIDRIEQEGKKERGKYI